MLISDANKITLTGALNSDPKVTSMRGDNQKVSFSLAVNKSIVNEDNQSSVLTSWINIVSFSATVVSAAQQLKKGDRVLVQGNLSVRSWIDEADDKKKHTIYEISVDKMVPLNGSDEMHVKGKDVNIAVLSGALDEIPFSGKTRAGKDMSSCSLRSSRAVVKKDDDNGNPKNMTSWFKVVSYDQGPTEQIASLKKDDKILVLGALSVNSWTADNQAERKTRYEIAATQVFNLESGEDSGLDDFFSGGSSDAEDDDIFN